jgi:uncharacterized membrane protein
LACAPTGYEKSENHFMYNFIHSKLCSKREYIQINYSKIKLGLFNYFNQHCYFPDSRISIQQLATKYEYELIQILDFSEKEKNGKRVDLTFLTPVAIAENSTFHQIYSIYPAYYILYTVNIFEKPFNNACR